MELYSAVVSTLTKNEFKLLSKNIRHHRERPSRLILKLIDADSYFEVGIEARYKDDKKYLTLGCFSLNDYYPHIKNITNGEEKATIVMRKAEIDAKRFYRKTLAMLAEDNYKLHLYDNGRIDIMVNSKPWRVKAKKAK